MYAGYAIPGIEYDISKLVTILGLFITVDFITGYAVAWKTGTVSSKVGLDGLIRKGSMLLAVLTFVIFDIVMCIDMLYHLPEQGKEVFNMIGITRVGLTEVMVMGMLLQEVASMFENLHLLGVPIPKFIANRLARIRKDYLEEDEHGSNTEEIKQ